MRTDGPVVIALDGSPHSVDTLNWGLSEADLRGSTALLARAYTERLEFTPWGFYPGLSDVRLDVRAEKYLAGQLEFAKERYPRLPVQTRLLSGPEVSELRALSDHAQLLVVGARGDRGPGRIGRVSAHLATHARCPVLMVGADQFDPSDPGAPVVVGVDGSAMSVAAAHVAATEASLRGAPLLVVHARPTIANPYGTPPRLMTEDEDDPVHRAAQQVAQALRDANPDVEVRTKLVDDDPVHALLRFAKHSRLLVVGSRGLGAFTGMLLGSISNELIRSCPSTVLVVHEAEVLE